MSKNVQDHGNSLFATMDMFGFSQSQSEMEEMKKMIDKQKQIEEKIELLKSTEKAIHGIMFSDTIIVYVLPDTTDQKLQEIQKELNKIQANIVLERKELLQLF